MLHGARGNNHSIALLKKLLCHRGICRIGIAGKLDTQLFHKVATTLHDIFLELHVGDTVHEQAAGTVIALDHTHASTTARKLPRRRQTGRAGANYGYERGIPPAGSKRRGPPVAHSWSEMARSLS